MTRGTKHSTRVALLFLAAVVACKGKSVPRDRASIARAAEPADLADRTVVGVAVEDEGEDEGRDEDAVKPIDFTTATDFPAELTDEDPRLWDQHVPEVREVTVPSSVDDEEQRAIFFDSGSERDKPLLVVLHSWSAGYRQNIDIPYAVWARENDWVFMHPHHRGPHDRPEATGSDLVVQDILDAVEYAKAHARVDEDRVYLAGYSGGGMMALVMAARHPEVWTAAVAYTPVVDLVDWYAYNRERERGYADDIAASCGGSPRPGTSAHAECRRRSPVSVLDNLRDEPLPIYVSTGVADDLVEPSHAIRAFNRLADRPDRIGRRDIAHIERHDALPPALEPGDPGPLARLYEAAGTPVLLRRVSRNVELVLFEGGHDLVYNPGLHWLHAQRRRPR